MSKPYPAYPDPLPKAEPWGLLEHAPYQKGHAGHEIKNFQQIPDHINTLLEGTWYQWADNSPVSVVAEDAQRAKAGAYLLPDCLSLESRFRRYANDNGLQCPKDEWFINYRKNMRAAWLTPWRMFRWDPHMTCEPCTLLALTERMMPRPWMDHVHNRDLLGGALANGSFQDNVFHATMIGAAVEQPKERRHEIRVAAAEEMFKCYRMKYKGKYYDKSFWENPTYNIRGMYHSKCVGETWRVLMQKGYVPDVDVEIPFVFKGKASEWLKHLEDQDYEFDATKQQTEAANNALARRWTQEELAQFGGAGILSAAKDTLNNEIVPRQDNWALGQGWFDYLHMAVTWWAPQTAWKWLFTSSGNLKNEVFNNMEDTKSFGVTPAANTETSWWTLRPIFRLWHGHEISRNRRNAYAHWAHRRATAARRERGTFKDSQEIPAFL
eukprot:TRINITY_DN104573_c0_g1_i1.p1 TRINITY_DN104573_c0_g1~~TRINITY_DN104573_c0_g1_i1.p1  ORF type:complete len:447 (+),score=52.08 TRINITY_DN104573_c0_g1_i1:32-1342(+)